jgi:hypothetical protein
MAWAFTSTCKRCVAGLHALGEALFCSGHGTVAGEVGVIFGAEAFDDIGACGFVVGVAQDERISEDAVLAIDVDGDLAGLGLAGGARAFVSEADISIGEAGESCGRSGVLGLGVGRMGCANDDGHCLLSSGVVSGPGPDFVLNLCPSARPGRGGGKKNRCGWCGRSEASHGRVDSSCGEGGEEPLVSP